ncbi:hypothetical protein [Mesorhizobium sp. 8]|uniref:hypothetical protein n=1 Tax=Mesorhizobium sp. 8 TaxID=2584466 RepID=UPI001122EF49|nr:hypothetical protein [Mesorhizobium sp. 8]QDC00370.1 hypothetical protein FGU64_08040 [Mesorhizobium sp. 8]
MKKADAAPSTSEISAEDLKRVVKEYGKQVANAAEYQGLAGQAIKTAIERHNLDRKAFRFTLGLSKMEEQKRQATLRGLLEYCHKMGFFDQTDAFDDIVDRMETIAAEIREGAGEPAKQDGVVAHLVQ